MLNLLHSQVQLPLAQRVVALTVLVVHLAQDVIRHDLLHGAPHPLDGVQHRPARGVGADGKEGELTLHPQLPPLVHSQGPRRPVVRAIVAYDHDTLHRVQRGRTAERVVEVLHVVRWLGDIVPMRPMRGTRSVISSSAGALPAQLMDGMQLGPKCVSYFQRQSLVISVQIAHDCATAFIQ